MIEFDVDMQAIDADEVLLHDERGELPPMRFVPERTCRLISHDIYFGSEDVGEMWGLSCGHEVLTECEPPKHCIECGAKVME